MQEIHPSILKRLLQRAQDGDHATVTHIYNAYAPFVERSLKILLGPYHPDIQDALQLVFIDILLGRTQFQGDAKFSTYLARMARNKAADLDRQRGARGAAQALHEFVAVDSEESLQIPDPAPEVVSLLLKAEQNEILDACIHALPAMERRAAYMAYQEDASLEEIAKEQRCKEGTIKSRLSSVRSKLVACLRRRYAERGAK